MSWRWETVESPFYRIEINASHPMVLHIGEIDMYESDGVEQAHIIRTPSVDPEDPLVYNSLWSNQRCFFLPITTCDYEWLAKAEIHIARQIRMIFQIHWSPFSWETPSAIEKCAHNNTRRLPMENRLIEDFQLQLRSVKYLETVPSVLRM